MDSHTSNMLFVDNFNFINFTRFFTSQDMHETRTKYIQDTYMKVYKTISWFPKKTISCSLNNATDGKKDTGCIKKVDKSEVALCFAKCLNVRCFFLLK